MRCSNVKYPKHPRQSRREPCGTVVATRSQTSLGILPLKPIFTYTYNPISSCLSRILPRIYANIIPLNSCEEADILFDITDGKAIRSQVSTYVHQIQISDVHRYFCMHTCTIKHYIFYIFHIINSYVYR